MSKLGRYSADRKKIQEIDDSAAGVSVTVADCGTIFVLKNKAQAVTIQLPKIADAGKGWWCKFVRGQAGGGNADVTIAVDTDDADKYHATNISGSRTANGTAHGSGSDGVVFDVSACNVGDQHETVCDGAIWYGQSFSSGTAAIIRRDA